MIGSKMQCSCSIVILRIFFNSIFDKNFEGLKIAILGSKVSWCVTKQISRMNLKRYHLYALMNMHRCLHQHFEIQKDCIDNRIEEKHLLSQFVNQVEECTYNKEFRVTLVQRNCKDLQSKKHVNDITSSGLILRLFKVSMSSLQILK